MKNRNLRIFTWITFLVYSLIIIFLMLLGRNINIPNSHGEKSYNLLPFKTIINYITNFYNINLGLFIINIVGNVAVFIPLGFMLPLLFRRMRKFIGVLAICTLLISISEILQYIFRIGTLDIDDLILNLIGCILGFVFYQKFYRNKQRNQK